MKKSLKHYLLEIHKIDEKKIYSLLLQRKILYKNEVVLNLNKKIEEENIVFISIKDDKKYVSRGAYKIIEAFKYFNLDVENKICLDIGSSTGGFTQVLLENGALKIYALDVGTNQLEYKIRNNKRVVPLEKTNFKKININMFNEKIEFACADVSFISVKNIFNVLHCVIKENSYFLCLIKPQFEAKKELVEVGGFVNEIHHNKIIEEVIKYSEKYFDFVGITKSPIKGLKSKNIEYLALFKSKV